VSEAPVDWSRAARRALPAMRAWRAAFHQDPELSGEEVRTREKVVQALGELGIPSTNLPGKLPAVVGLLQGESPGPVVALRADMDALPIEEATGLSFRSRRPGVMHACGHDVHLASLLGAAFLLSHEPRALAGPVKLLFQPAEEEGTTGGAQPMIDQGCLEKPKVDYVVGQHVDPGLPLGKIGWGIGPFMAAADSFFVTVHGRGGHASSPQQGPDAILVASEIVVGLQALASRVRDPCEPVVVSVGSIHGGTRHNILPQTVSLEGTVRTVRAPTRDLIERTLKRRVRAIASSLGARVTITYRRGYPALVNPGPATTAVVRALEVEFGRGALVEVDQPLMGAEDFARYLERVPGTFLRLGVGGAGPPSSLHSSTFAPDERAMVVGAATLAAAAVGLQRGPR
jgi:amidohydrolase